MSADENDETFEDMTFEVDGQRLGNVFLSGMLSGICTTLVNLGYPADEAEALGRQMTHTAVTDEEVRHAMIVKINQSIAAQPMDPDPSVETVFINRSQRN